jgi:hypothetical protein
VPADPPAAARVRAWTCRPGTHTSPITKAGLRRLSAPLSTCWQSHDRKTHSPLETGLEHGEQAQANNDGDDTSLDGIDDAVSVAAQAAQVAVAVAEAEAEAEATSAGERLAGMMRVRGGMGAGASALSVESPDADIKAAYEGASAQERSVFLVKVGEQEKMKIVSLGLDVPEAAPSGLTPGASFPSESPTLGQLSVPATLDLKPHDFRELWHEKKSARTAKARASGPLPRSSSGSTTRRRPSSSG